MFIEITSLKDEPFLLNVSAIVGVTVTKSAVIVYYGDMEYVSVKESFDEVKKLLAQICPCLNSKI